MCAKLLFFLQSMDFYASKCPVITDSESDRYTYMGVCLSHTHHPYVHLLPSCFTWFSFAPRHIPCISGKQSESGQNIKVTMKKSPSGCILTTFTRMEIIVIDRQDRQSSPKVFFIASTFSALSLSQRS